MRAGRLDKKISVINPVPVQSTVSGTPTITWSTYLGNVWADVQSITNRDIYRSGVDGQQLVHNITIRYATGIDSNMRVVYGGSTYLIQNVSEFPHDRVEMLTMRLST